MVSSTKPPRSPRYLVRRDPFGHDKELHRLVAFLNCATDYGWNAKSGEAVESLRLQLYADASLAGDPQTCRSHSGILLAVTSNEGSYFPLCWYAKRSEEALLKRKYAVAKGLFNEAIPTQPSFS